MTFMSGTPRELEGKRTYTPTGKEPEAEGNTMDLASWMLASRMQEALAGPATVGDIYYTVTRSMGMSAAETAALVKVAKSRGYLK